MSQKNILLGVNIDHVATLRQARGTYYPDPVHAALQIEQAGADSITLHLREDRRHIQDKDVYDLKARMLTRMNLEMAVTDEMIKIAEDVKPEDCCLVPESRQELTTEGGLDVVSNAASIRDACVRLGEAGIKVSLFIDADNKQIDAAKQAGAPAIEIHTGHYADAVSREQREQIFVQIKESVIYANKIGLYVNAGHGLNLRNLRAIAELEAIRELNIGHALVADAVFMGLDQSVKRYKQAMYEARA